MKYIKKGHLTQIVRECPKKKAPYIRKAATPRENYQQKLACCRLAAITEIEKLGR